MSSPIYVDFDETLIHAETDPRGEYVVKVHPRPGAGRFLERLSRHAPVYILSHAYLEHVQNSLPALSARAQRSISGILSREDMKPVIQQLEDIFWSGESPLEQERRRRGIPPIAPPGVMFDDQPVGSYLFQVKSTSLGIGPDSWIQVTPFDPRVHDPDALERAYRQFKERFVENATPA